MKLEMGLEIGIGDWGLGIGLVLKGDLEILKSISEFKMIP